MPKTFVLTHGETHLDQEGRMHGQRVDAPLSWKGKQTARLAAQKLKNKGVTKIFCSPLKRAHETALIIGKLLNVPVEVKHELMPWDIASMSGAKVSSIKPLLDYFSARPDRKIPGGESKNEFLKRYKDFMRQLEKESKPVAIAGHSQHSLGIPYLAGAKAEVIPVVGGKAGEIKEIHL